MSDLVNIEQLLIVMEIMAIGCAALFVVGMTFVVLNFLDRPRQQSEEDRQVVIRAGRAQRLAERQARRAAADAERERIAANAHIPDTVPSDWFSK